MNNERLWIVNFELWVFRIKLQGERGKNWKIWNLENLKLGNLSFNHRDTENSQRHSSLPTPIIFLSLTKNTDKWYNIRSFRIYFVEDKIIHIREKHNRTQTSKYKNSSIIFFLICICELYFNTIRIIPKKTSSVHSVPSLYLCGSSGGSSAYHLAWILGSIGRLWKKNTKTTWQHIDFENRKG